MAKSGWAIQFTISYKGDQQSEIFKALKMGASYSF